MKKELWSDCFVANARVVFEFVGRKLQSESPVVSSVSYECEVLYQNEQFRVAIRIDVGTFPWLELGKSVNGKWRHKGLHQAFARAFNKALREGPEDAVTSESIQLRLRSLANVLQESWDDLFAAF